MPLAKIFQDLLRDIPDYKEFLTLDELDASSRALAAAHPEVVSISEMGRTKNGHPLLCLKIGSGSKTGLMFGCPHPNEPIGTMMLEYLTERLASDKELRDALDYTWYVVKAWDADGLKLNEKWLKGPYTIFNYSRNFFRPAGHKQVDWTFPVDYKEHRFHEPIPETKAMMALIDEIKPHFIYSLHNAGFGGVYWYMSGPLDGLYDELYAAANKVDVPINFGEPEAPYCEAFAPAVYRSLGIEQNYDYVEKFAPAGTDLSKRFTTGNCSETYARTRHGSFTLLTELPYFFDPRIKDTAPGTMSRRDAVLKKLDMSEASDRYLRETLAMTSDKMDPDNPFLLALKAFTTGSNNDAVRKMAETDPDYQRTASVAEEFDDLLVSRVYKLLSCGMLIRANELELEKMASRGDEDAEKRAAYERAMAIAVEHHKALADELEREIDYQVVPIRKLVSIQLECGLLVAQTIHGR